jgi:hypothetical protein
VVKNSAPRNSLREVFIHTYRSNCLPECSTLSMVLDPAVGIGRSCGG